MDYQRFIRQLPELYHNWGQPSVRPKSEVFGAVLEQVQGMTTANVMQLLNFAVECMELTEVYCEIGSLQGATLIGALLNHRERIAYAVDNFSELDLSGLNFEILSNNLSRFNLEEQVIFCNQDFEEFFFDLKNTNPQVKIGVYFYDGSHDYRSQLVGLLLAKPFLAEKALIIVDDSNWSTVQQANWDFLSANFQCQLLLDLPTAKTESSSFWNGLQVFSWDVSQESSYEWSIFVEKYRNELVIRLIYDLYAQAEVKGKDRVVESLEKQALAAHQSKKITEAEEKYKEILQWNTSHVNTYHNLGMLYYEMGRYQDALAMLHKCLSLDESEALYNYSLGLVLEKIANNYQAIQAYQKAIVLNPQYIDAYNNLGNILYKSSDFEQAESIYRQAIATNPKHFGSYLNLLNVLVAKDEMDEAIAVANQASRLLPNHLALQLANARLLPIIYDTPEEIDFYRDRFTQHLEELIRQTSLDNPEAVRALSFDTNFYLQAQGKNDLELQILYGDFVHRIMAAHYPQWANPLDMPPVNRDKIRVGYVSAYLKQHNGASWALQWLKNHHRQELEIYCYYTGLEPDLTTQQFRIYSDTFHHIPEKLEVVCQQIAADKLHILVYTDIGMDPQTTQAAGLRLAPVQCTTVGHPITSGLPTIDYYLSSELMEPENASEHYSEKLIRLPNLGMSYPKPVLPETRKTRRDFQLPSDAVVYLSCQSLWKYLPQYDDIFPEIALKVPQAKFGFIEYQLSDAITNKFKQRLKTAFAKRGLNGEEYCLIMPRLNQSDYLNLNLVSDIFLDTFAWSGNNTTLAAIACNLPVVTCPGEFMRGRHSYGILKMLGVTETIADSEAKYIEIAVRLGVEPEWRKSIVQQIIQNQDRVYEDKTCVTALEEFYRSVAQSE